MKTKRFVSACSRFLLGWFGFFLAIPALQAQDSGVPGPVKVTHRYDVRRTVDGHYEGLFYGYQTGTWTYTPRAGGGWDVSTRYLIAQESRRDHAEVEKPLSQELQSEFWIDPHGVWSPSQGRTVPPYQNFPPALPDNIVSGGTWEAAATIIVDPAHNGKFTRLPVLVGYQLRNPAKWNGQNVFVVAAKFALRYKRDQDPYGDPGLVNADGSRDATIYYDSATRRPIFIRELTHEVFVYAPEKTIQEDGFILTFFEGFQDLDETETARKIEEGLKSEGVKDVQVAPTQEGVRLTLDNLLFVADRTLLLPGENRRLDTIAEALKKIPDRSLRVIGHTADVGNSESQQELSEERAIAIVQELKKRGVEARRLFYEGQGGQNPVASNDTETGRAENRRVEILILND